MSPVSIYISVLVDGKSSFSNHRESIEYTQGTYSDRTISLKLYLDLVSLVNNPRTCLVVPSNPS